MLFFPQKVYIDQTFHRRGCETPKDRFQQLTCRQQKEVFGEAPQVVGSGETVRRRARAVLYF